MCQCEDMWTTKVVPCFGRVGWIWEWPLCIPSDPAGTADCPFRMEGNFGWCFLLSLVHFCLDLLLTSSDCFSCFSLLFYDPSCFSCFFIASLFMFLLTFPASLALGLFFPVFLLYFPYLMVFSSMVFVALTFGKLVFNPWVSLTLCLHF